MTLQSLQIFHEQIRIFTKKKTKTNHTRSLQKLGTGTQPQVYMAGTLASILKMASVFVTGTSRETLPTLWVRGKPGSGRTCLDARQQEPHGMLSGNKSSILVLLYSCFVLFLFCSNLCFRLVVKQFISSLCRDNRNWSYFKKRIVGSIYNRGWSSLSVLQCLNDGAEYRCIQQPFVKMYFSALSPNIGVFSLSLFRKMASSRGLEELKKFCKLSVHSRIWWHFICFWNSSDPTDL